MNASPVPPAQPLELPADPQITPLLEQQIAMLLDLTRAVAEVDDLQSAFQRLLQPIAEATGWCYGEAWLPDERQGQLRSICSWHTDDPRLAAFAAGSKLLRFTEGAGLLGRAWQLRSTEWVADIAAIDPGLAVAPARVQEAGLRSVFILPITARDDVLALLVFFARDARPRNEPLIRLITLVAAQIGAAMQRLAAVAERERSEAALRALNSELEARVAERTAQYVQVNATLAASEQRYRALVEDMSEVFFRTDSAGRWSLLNPAWTTITGFPVADSLGQEFIGYVHPDDRERNMELFRPLIAREKESCRHEVRYLTREGGHRWVEVFARLTFDEHGEVNGTCGTLNDITERRTAEQQLRQAEERLRQANDELEQRVAARTVELAAANARLLQESAERAQTEQQLRQSEERFRQIAEHISEVFYIFDLDSQSVLYVSPSYERIWGRSCASLYADSRSFVEGIHADDRAAAFDSLRRQAEGEVTEEFYRLTAPDGTMRWIRDRAFPVRDQHGRPYRVVGLAEDTTQQRTAERLLQQTNDELARLLAVTREAQQAAELARRDIDNLLSRVTEGFVALDAGWNVRYINGQAAEVIGRPAEALFGRPFWDELPALVGRPIHTSCLRALERQQALTVEEHAQARDRWYECRIYPSSEGVSIFFQDVTEHKQTEAALRQANETLERRVAERTAALSEANHELERAARLKDEFLANMSHELRTPLNAILTLTEAVTEGVYGPLTERQASALGSVSESGTHLLALINDILDLAKIESGNVELQAEPTDVEEIAVASMRMVRQIAHAKRLRISSSLDPTVDVVEADPRRLKQILVNLLSNAVKFTPKGGIVSLEVSGNRAAGVVHFSVEDSGIGIEPEAIPRLFRPFVQLDSSLNRRHEGTGLGLALVARLSELHGGGVSVSSTPGHGSRFVVSLPWQVQPEQPPAAPGGAQPIQGPAPQEAPVVLLAEDNALVLHTTMDYLEARGYRVRPARNGAEAVAMARELRPALVLMDIQMPVMDGLEAMRQIRADPAVAGTPIIALTALAMVGDRERCLEAGANDYLSKPVSMVQLVERIEQLRRPRAPR